MYVFSFTFVLNSFIKRVPGCPTYTVSTLSQGLVVRGLGPKYLWTGTLGDTSGSSWVGTKTGCNGGDSKVLEISVIEIQIIYSFVFEFL